MPLYKEGVHHVVTGPYTGSLGLYWMPYSICPLGPSSMSVAPLFPAKPVNMVVPIGVSWRQRREAGEREREKNVSSPNILRAVTTPRHSTELIIQYSSAAVPTKPHYKEMCISNRRWEMLQSAAVRSFALTPFAHR